MSNSKVSFLINYSKGGESYFLASESTFPTSEHKIDPLYTSTFNMLEDGFGIGVDSVEQIRLFADDDGSYYLQARITTQAASNLHSDGFSWIDEKRVIPNMSKNVAQRVNS